MSGRKQIAAIIYDSLDEIPDGLKAMEIVLLRDGLVEYDITYYSPGDAIPDGLLKVGAVLYGDEADLPIRRAALLAGSFHYSVTAINTPSTGANPELVTNGNMETGIPPTGWTGSGATMGVAAERTDGTGLQSLLITNSGTNYGDGRRTITLGAGPWLHAAGYLERITAPNRLMVGSDITRDGSSTPGVWILVSGNGRLTTANPTVRIQNTSNTDTYSSCGDDISVKAFVLSSLYTATPDTQPNGHWYADISGVVAGTQGGFGHIDANGDGWWAHADSTTAYLVKYVAGVYAAGSSGAITYADGRRLAVTRYGNSLQLYYNSLAVGSTVTMSDLPTLTQTIAMRTDMAVSVTANHYA